MKQITRKNFLLATAVATFGVSFSPGIAFAAPGISLVSGFNKNKQCIENGFDYRASNNIAEGLHCYATDNNSTNNVLAIVDKTKTLAMLQTIEEKSPFNPSPYLV